MDESLHRRPSPVASSAASGAAAPCRLWGGRLWKPLAVLAVVFCTAGASCTRTLRSPFAAWAPPAPEVLAVGSSLDQVMAAVNQNAARITSYQTNNASISVPGMPGIPLLRGNIAAQRPGRLRLQASTAVFGPEVDLGANDELFWFWVKRNEPPALYFARHDQYCGSEAQKLMPIEPQWLLDALGFAEFRPGDRHDGPRPAGDGKVEITSVIQSPCGMFTKKTVVDARRAWVLEQHMYDASGALAASAVAKSHRFYPELGVSLPQELEIRIPASGLSLSIDVGTVELNTLGDAPQRWTLPTISGAAQVDLGSLPHARSVTPLGDQIARANWYGPGPTGVAPLEAAAPAGVAVQAPPRAMEQSPQFLPPGGIAAEAPAGGGDAGAQRLPTGGLSAQPELVR